MKKKKLKIKNLILLILALICTATLAFSIYHIILWHIDNKNTDKIDQEISDMVQIYEHEDTEETVIIEPPVEIKKDNPYFDYIKMNLINVDFTNLIATNPDTKGWIQVNGTNINYPFVQADNNEYYLTHSFNKSNNTAGWVFMDYRNNLDGDDKNTILYAHGRVNGTMFGTLKNILTNDWSKNTDNYVVKLSTETENTLWQIFSVYRIPTTGDYLTVNFSNDQEFLDFANMLLERSQFDFNTSVSETDKILTLSTCYNSTDKVVLHAKLIKSEAR